MCLWFRGREDVRKEKGAKHSDERDKLQSLFLQSTCIFTERHDRPSDGGSWWRLGKRSRSLPACFSVPLPRGRTGQTQPPAKSFVSVGAEVSRDVCRSVYRDFQAGESYSASASCPQRPDFPLGLLLIRWISHSSNAPEKLLLGVVLIHLFSLCSVVHTQGPELNTTVAGPALGELTALQEVCQEERFLGCI